MSRSLAALGIFAAIWAVGLPAQARIFNLNDENFAAYVRGSYGPALTNALNSQSSGNNISVNSEHPYHLSGEFGFMYAMPWLNIRFGLELLKPADIKDAVGKTSSGSEMYTMTSEISVMIPKVALEVTLHKSPLGRVYLEGGAGYANLAARNSYTMTAAGTAATGLSDFYEDLRGNTMAYEGAVGLESLLTDSTTIVFEGGYRSLVFDDIKHNRDVTSFQGSVVKGDRAKNMNGDNRSLNMSNWFTGIALRFWIQ